MKKAFAIAGALALALTPAVSFACDLSGANLSRANLTNANLGNADLSGADLSGVNMNIIFWTSRTKANNLRGCPSSLPRAWVCENNSLRRQR